MDMESSAEFRFDGGATWVNLLATKGRSFGPRPVERLPTTEAAARWLTQAGFAPTSEVTAADLERIVELREALRDVAMALMAEQDPSPDSLGLLESVVSTSGPRVLPAALGDGEASVEAALGAIAMQALVTLAGPDRALLKECAEADCRWVFLDTSGRRHWCPSPSCASRGRVRAYRARRATAPSE